MFKTQKEIMTILNNSGLNVEQAIFIIKDIYRDLLDLYDDKSEEEKEEAE